MFEFEFRDESLYVEGEPVLATEGRIRSIRYEHEMLLLALSYGDPEHEHFENNVIALDQQGLKWRIDSLTSIVDREPQPFAHVQAYGDGELWAVDMSKEGEYQVDAETGRLLEARIRR